MWPEQFPLDKLERKKAEFAEAGAITLLLSGGILKLGDYIGGLRYKTIKVPYKVLGTPNAYNQSYSNKTLTNLAESYNKRIYNQILSNE